MHYGIFPLRSIRSHRVALALIAGCFAAASRSAADDRFSVPMGGSSSGSSGSSSSGSYSSGSSSSSSSSGSYDSGSSSNSSSSSSSSSSDRFNVPMPGSSRGGSGYRGGGYGGGSYWDPYWGGSYYWEGRYYYWGGYYYSPFYDSFDRYRYGYSPYYYDYPRASRTTSSSNERLPVFFPATPPPMGAPLPPQQPIELRLVAPAELAAYTYEPFYAPLSTRLNERNLTDRLRQRLDAYKATRTGLLTELRAKLDALPVADAATRQRELEAFAHEQTPRLAEAEKTAEQLRVDLLRNGLVGLFWGTGDWNETRQWRLGKDGLARERSATLAAEFQVMRAAVFYQDGLSPAQRRLLREVAMELQVEAFKPKTATASPENNTLVFFSPETARFQLPENLSQELATKIETYTQEKTEIKTELRDTLYKLDSAGTTQRTQALKQLAESQSPRLAALEVLADDIRQSLTLQGKVPGPPTPPALPSAIVDRIAAYQKEKLALQKLLQEKLREIRRALAPTKVNFVKDEANSKSDLHPLKIQVSPALPSEDQQKPVRDTMAAFNRENNARFTALGVEKEAIRNELARLVGPTSDATSGKSVDTLLKEFEEAVTKQDAWQLYRDYRTAVFEPGLSPEQRRLLFGAALEKLALPMPGGERQP
jgi:hypothetical protein